MIEPAAGVLGDSFGGPLRRRGDQRLLHRVLRRGKVTLPANDGGEHLRPQLAQQVLQSTGQPVSAVGPYTEGRGTSRSRRYTVSWPR